MVDNPDENSGGAQPLSAGERGALGQPRHATQVCAIIELRSAQPQDAAAIAALHALSWRRAYRGILRDQFLDGPVFANRLELWRARLADSEACTRQQTWIAHERGAIQGFACVIPDVDPTWGALLDNLHVVPASHGRGLGRLLLSTAAKWLLQRSPHSLMPLWVYDQNLAARRFYERCGAAMLDTQTELAPDGCAVTAVRYGVADVRRLAAHTGAGAA
jgi:GNAT superfamily N-acetyltransferase